MRDDAATRNAATEEYAPKARRRATDFDDDEPEPERRVRVRLRGSLLPQSKWGRIAAGGTLVVLLGMITAGVLSARSLLMHDARFAVDSSEAIEIHGNAHVSRAALLNVFGADLERNIFFVPLAERRTELESMPWVKHATVMRLLPGRIRVEIAERTPVAFVRQGAKIGLVDASGVLLDMPADAHYSFPVVSGVSANDPASVREARMHQYATFINEMDSSGQKISEQLSEVDLSSPEDVKATITENSGEVLVHFGEGDFLARYRKFEQHLPDWLTQYPKLASVDMRYDRQVVLEMQPGSDGAAPAAPAVPPTGAAEVASSAPAPIVKAVTTPHVTAEHKVVSPSVPAKSVAAPVKEAAKAASTKPAVAAKPTATKPADLKPVVLTPATTKPAALKPVVTKPVAKAAPTGAAAARLKAEKAAQTKAMLARGKVLKEQRAQTATQP